MQSRCKQSNQHDSTLFVSSSSGKFGNNISSDWFLGDQTNDLAESRKALLSERLRRRGVGLFACVIVAVVVLDDVPNGDRISKPLTSTSDVELFAIIYYLHNLLAGTTRVTDNKEYSGNITPG